MRPTHRAPPTVRVQDTEEPTALQGVGWAYLIAWLTTPVGPAARITWAEQYQVVRSVGEPYQWRWVQVDTPRGKVSTVEGQSYTQVPTWVVEWQQAEEPPEKTWREQSWGGSS